MAITRFHNASAGKNLFGGVEAISICKFEKRKAFLAQERDGHLNKKGLELTQR